MCTPYTIMGDNVRSDRTSTADQENIIKPLITTGNAQADRPQGPSFPRKTPTGESKTENLSGPSSAARRNATFSSQKTAPHCFPLGCNNQRFPAKKSAGVKRNGACLNQPHHYTEKRNYTTRQSGANPWPGWRVYRAPRRRP